MAAGFRGGISAPRGRLAKPGDCCLPQSAWGLCCRLVGRGQGCCVHSSARDGPTTKRYPAQRVSRAGAETLCSGRSVSGRGKSTRKGPETRNRWMISKNRKETRGALHTVGSERGLVKRGKELDCSVTAGKPAQGFGQCGFWFMY